MSVESVKSLYEHVSDRIKDPFLGVFSFFIVLLNWKIFLVTFSEETFYYKMFVIENLVKDSNYRSAWFPFFISILFFLCSSVMKILFRFVTQFFQRVDDWFVKIPMDQEKISLLKENTLMRIELDKAVQRNEELLKLHIYVKGFLIDVNPITSDFMTKTNPLISYVSQINMSADSQIIIRSHLNDSIALANKIQNFKTNVAQVYNIKE